MQNPRLASRYAKSLLDLAIEQNVLEAALKDMQAMHSICELSNDFVMMLRSPVIKGDKKQTIINAVLAAQNMSALTKAFIALLVSKGREENLPEIATAFITAYNQLKNIRTVNLVTATPVNDTVKSSILARLNAYIPNGTIDLKTAVDESLIGGFVLEVGDKLYDASVKKSLSDVKSRILDHTYESKM